MIHTVKEWMSTPVIVIDPDSSISYALTLMRRRDIRSLVVPLDGNTPLQYGILTTTDIRDKIIAFERNPAETTVRQIMTAPVINHRPPGMDSQGMFAGNASTPYQPSTGCG